MALQLAIASKPATVYGQLTARDASGDPQREAIATFKGTRYVPANDVATSSTRGRTSWISRHGLFVRELRRDGVTLGKSFWACGLCDHRKVNRLFVASSTASPIYYLEKEHKVYRDTPEGSSTDDSRIASQSEAFPSRLSRDTIQELALGAIISSNLAFSIFEDPFLEQMLQTLNPALFNATSWKRTLLRSRLNTVFDAKRIIIHEDLQAAISRIHLAFDLWTSPSRAAIMGVSAHYIDSEGTLQQRLIALREQYGAHTGDNLALNLADVIADWDLAGRLGCLVSDNATNNDKCGSTLFQQIQPSYTFDDVTHRRIRCYGHVLNLVGRAFLYGEDFEAFEQESQAHESQASSDDELRH
ncbi:transposase-like protein [Colletotrichum musicola]|uniref:Transposase-like protein n=1 Tax=Colletotrichum musicola TaxID=2175873 RepID=A0A8H6MQL5_9PEZI|nr:transposase-like protein [Colletotrichum musicola]